MALPQTMAEPYLEALVNELARLETQRDEARAALESQRQATEAATRRAEEARRELSHWADVIEEKERERGVYRRALQRIAELDDPSGPLISEVARRALDGIE